MQEYFEKYYIKPVLSKANSDGKLVKIDMRDIVAVLVENTHASATAYLETDNEKTYICPIVPGDARPLESVTGLAFSEPLYVHFADIDKVETAGEALIIQFKRVARPV